jgi:hypothetical protein
MIAQRILFVAGVMLAGSASASDLSYTFLDFQYTNNEVDASGSQVPVPNQVVSVDSGTGDGISVAGSFAFSPRFQLDGSFESSIVKVTGAVENPLGVTQVSGDYDMVIANLGFGYRQPFGENFDLLFEVTYDSANYDFGSFAGENFDVQDSGAGARVGFRWNPVPALEVYSFAHHSPVAKANLDRLEFEDDTLFRTGFMWYFFGDLGLGLDYESGPVKTATVSMRFSFGELALR